MNYQESSALGLLTSVTEGKRAVDTSPLTASILNVGVAGTVVQYLAFSTGSSRSTITEIGSNTVATIKFTMPRMVIGIGASIEIGTFILEDVFLLGLSIKESKPEYTEGSLLNLLNGEGEVQIEVSSGNKFHGVYLKFKGLGVALDSKFFYAYVDSNQPVGANERDDVVDVLHGVRSQNLLSLAPLTTLISNADATYTRSGYVKLKTLLGTGDELYHTTIFKTSSNPNQLIKVVLEQPDGLLKLDLLGSLIIQPYLGDAKVGPSLTSSEFLSIKLLAGTTGKYELTLPVDQPFDRIEIMLTSALSVLGELWVHEVSRTFGAFVAANSSANSACGEVDLQQTIMNYQPDHYSYGYYSTETGEMELANSKVTESGTYYIETKDLLTELISDQRTAVEVTVLPEPGKPYLTIYNEIN